MWKHQDYRTVHYLVLDLETTGLNPKQDEIISVGMVTIEQWRVQLRTTQHILLKPSQSVANSAIYHGIVDQQLSEAQSISDVLPLILQRLTDHVLVVHGAAIDAAFLDAASRRLCSTPLCAQVIDTMALGKRAYRLENHPAVPENGLRLHHLRQQYGLPPYSNHHALSDAIATAELFLAITSHLAGNQPLAVSKLF